MGRRGGSATALGLRRAAGRAALGARRRSIVVRIRGNLAGVLRLSLSSRGGVGSTCRDRLPRSITGPGASTSLACCRVDVGGACADQHGRAAWGGTDSGGDGGDSTGPVAGWGAVALSARCRLDMGGWSLHLDHGCSCGRSGVHRGFSLDPSEHHTSASGGVDGARRPRVAFHPNDTRTVGAADGDLGRRVAGGHSTRGQCSAM